MKDIEKEVKDHVAPTQQQPLEPMKAGGDAEVVIVVRSQRLHTCQLQSRPECRNGIFHIRHKAKADMSCR